MLDIQYIRKHPDEVKQAVANRQMAVDIDRLLVLDAQRRALLTEVEQLKNKRNTASKEIGGMKEQPEREAKIAEMRAVGGRIAEIDAQVREVEAERYALLIAIPNIPDPRTPVGATEDENVVTRVVGEKREFDFTPKAHWDLGTELGIIDFERGVKLSGSRFYVLNGAGALLQRALIAWMLDLHIKQGYQERYVPVMVKEVNFYGAGQLPKFRDNIYHDVEDDAWFVTTAEVPLTNLRRDEILSNEELPQCYTAYTPCFRREKVSAGKDVRGMKRGHQFDKVEMYAFTHPDKSDEFLEKMLADAEETCALLGLTYRIKLLVTADIGFSSRITYDIEVWAPGCDEWLEVSSVSNCGDFQARRVNTRYRPPAQGKTARPQFVHTLNGSGLGLPRTMIAILENYQQADGSVVVPEVLHPWMGGIEVIEQLS